MFTSMLGLSKIWPSAKIPVLRRSGEEESLVSRLWQRSPSRPVSDDAFSRPSNSMTTQREVWPDDAAVGTRKPDREDSWTTGDIMTIFWSYFSKNGHVHTVGCCRCTPMWVKRVTSLQACVRACLCTYHSRWTSPAAAPWSGSRPLPPSLRHSRAPPPPASTERRHRGTTSEDTEVRWEHVVMETEENVVLLLYWENWGRRRRWMNRGLFQTRGWRQWYFKSFILIFNCEKKKSNIY